MKEQVSAVVVECADFDNGVLRCNFCAVAVNQHQPSHTSHAKSCPLNMLFQDEKEFRTEAGEVKTLQELALELLDMLENAELKESDNDQREFDRILLHYRQQITSFKTAVDLSRYTLMKSDKSTCPCGYRVHILFPTGDDAEPIYYLCEHCGRIVLAGSSEEISPGGQR